jgi:plastocyanin
MRKLLVGAAVLAAAFASTAFGATKTVAVKDNFFSPKSISISKGTKVTWKWRGTAFHNVTVKKGPQKFHSKTISSGSYSHTFKTAGTYTLVCTVHLPNMKMTVKVH